MTKPIMAFSPTPVIPNRNHHLFHRDISGYLVTFLDHDSASMLGATCRVARHVDQSIIKEYTHSFVGELAIGMGTTIRDIYEKSALLQAHDRWRAHSYNGDYDPITHSFTYKGEKSAFFLDLNPKYKIPRKSVDQIIAGNMPNPVIIMGYFYIAIENCSNVTVFRVERGKPQRVQVLKGDPEQYLTHIALSYTKEVIALSHTGKIGRFDLRTKLVRWIETPFSIAHGEERVKARESLIARCALSAAHPRAFNVRGKLVNVSFTPLGHTPIVSHSYDLNWEILHENRESDLPFRIATKGNLTASTFGNGLGVHLEELVFTRNIPLDPTETDRIIALSTDERSVMALTGLHHYVHEYHFATGALISRKAVLPDPPARLHARDDLVKLGRHVIVYREDLSPKVIVLRETEMGDFATRTLNNLNLTSLFAILYGRMMEAEPTIPTTLKSSDGCCDIM